MRIGLFLKASLILSVVTAVLTLTLFYKAPQGSKITEEEPRGAMDSVGRKYTFADKSLTGGFTLPEAWQVRGKLGTKPAGFSVRADSAAGKPYLHMEADKASGSLITGLDGVDLKESPIVRWKWRAERLPEKADGRIASRDDQAIGIYVSSGSALGSKSISYRWDTETPKGAEGKSSYMLGGAKIKWYTMRNKTDARESRWFVEERNVADDFIKAWGFCPEKVYLALSCNSQYTGSKAAADLEWIEFTRQI